MKIERGEAGRRGGSREVRGMGKDVLRNQKKSEI